MITSNLLILQAIWCGYLYIQQIKNAKEVFVCFDINGTRNDSWPSKWNRMEICKVNSTRALRHSIPSNSTHYKLRIRGGDDVMFDTNWTHLYSKIIHTQIPVENCNTSYVIYYIALCTTFIVVYYATREIWKAA